jgi:hypothetical protein
MNILSERECERVSMFDRQLPNNILRQILHGAGTSVTILPGAKSGWIIGCKFSVPPSLTLGIASGTVCFDPHIEPQKPRSGTLVQQRSDGKATTKVLSSLREDVILNVTICDKSDGITIITKEFKMQKP